MEVYRQHRLAKHSVSLHLDKEACPPAGQPEQIWHQAPPESSDTDTAEPDSSKYTVHWSGGLDSLNPKNWSITKRILVAAQVSAIGFVVTAAGAIDTAVLPQAAADLGVSEVAELVATGIYLVAFGIGCLLAGPFSETFGRFAVYAGSLAIFGIWIMASALAPNYGAQLVFRFLAGLSGSAPLVCAGGTMSDIYGPTEKTWGFPLYTVLPFGGPMLGLVVGAYIGPNTSWRWAEWSILIASGVVLVIITLFMPETFAPLLLDWKAEYLRKSTGDDRYRSSYETSDATLFSRLKISLTRPFLMATEPIIALWTVYLTIIYIVIFTFLDGYPFIFEQTYGTSQGVTHLIFIAMFIGVLAILPVVPFVYRISHREKNRHFSPEARLWYAMLTGPFIPIALFWMGWTAKPSISIWSPIVASFFLGYGTMGVFLSTYMYIIDSYEIFAASALTFCAVVRYIIAGGMTVAGLPIYRGLGVGYTCTILACVSAVMVPLPYVLFWWGPAIRKKSKFAVIQYGTR